jgi:hypothetical protein
MFHICFIYLRVPGQNLPGRRDYSAKCARCPLFLPGELQTCRWPGTYNGSSWDNTGRYFLAEPVIKSFDKVGLKPKLEIERLSRM